MLHLYNDLFNTICQMMDHPDEALNGYNIWLCWDEQDHRFTIQFSGRRARMPDDAIAGHQIVKRIVGWSPNMEDPGSRYIHLLEGIRKMFKLEGVVPPDHISNDVKHPGSFDYIK